MIAKTNLFVYTVLSVYGFISEYVIKNKRWLKTEKSFEPANQYLNFYQSRNAAPMIPASFPRVQVQISVCLSLCLV